MIAFLSLLRWVLNLDAQIPERSSNGGEVMSTTRKIPLDKHPLGKPPHPTTLMTDPPSIVIPSFLRAWNPWILIQSDLLLCIIPVLLVLLGWMLMLGVVCAAASSLLLLLCALLWLLWDTSYLY